MNLKESYRYQNVLLETLQTAFMILSKSGAVCETTYTNLISKVMPDMQDETYVDEPTLVNFSHLDKITELAEFVEYLIDEKEIVADAIRKAKATASIDIDSQAGLNALRQKAAKVLRRMDENKSEEKIVSRGGVGYRFDANGNQVSFKCDQKIVTKINFNRDKVRRIMKRLEQNADAISSALDEAAVNVNVDFTPTFDVNDSFNDMFEQFLGFSA